MIIDPDYFMEASHYRGKLEILKLYLMQLLCFVTHCTIWDKLRFLSKSQENCDKKSNVRHKNIRNGLPPPKSLGAGSLTTIGSKALLLCAGFGKVISSSAAVVANSTVVVTTSSFASVDMGSNTSGKSSMRGFRSETGERSGVCPKEETVAAVEQLHVLFVVSGKDKESESSNEEAKSSLLNCTNGCIMKDCCAFSRGLARKYDGLIDETGDTNGECKVASKNIRNSPSHKGGRGGIAAIVSSDKLKAFYTMENVLPIWFIMRPGNLFCICCIYFWEAPKDCCRGDIKSLAAELPAIAVAAVFPELLKVLGVVAQLESHSFTLVCGFISICKVRQGSVDV
uniref:Uncharacterized protein n=1 Tax=Glossina palpalis gambiensis TaxID=67801 RepID=A0A1B0ARI6_9MUSC